MSKKIQLSIPTPCHENWENMTPVEKGRFCGSCQKQVVDFSKMSNREIAIFFKKPSTGSLCGRFMEDQLDRDIEIPKKRIPWLKYFFQIALPAFLMSAKATAQGKVIRNETICVSENRNFNDTLILPEVVVVAYPPKIVGKLAVANPSVSQVPKEDTTNTSTQICSVRVGGAIAVRRTIIKPDSIFKKIKKIIFDDVPFKNFKIYPNPAKAGTSLNIEWKQSETGKFVLQLFSPAGQLAFSKELSIDGETRLLNIEVPPVAAGAYFLRMTSKQSGKTLTEKLIIQ